MICLFLTIGIQSLITFEAGKGGNRTRTVLGFTRATDCTRRSQTRSCLVSKNGGVGQQTRGITNKDGVIIVDHGSRRKESNLMLSKLISKIIL